MVSIFGGRMLEDQPVTIFGDGQQTRDFVFVDDVVHAFVLAMERGDGLRCNIGTGEETSVNELFTALAEVIGYSRQAEHAPERPGELRNIALDARLASTELGWKPWTTLREGLTETVRWLRG